jgi:hypothetical protein
MFVVSLLIFKFTILTFLRRIKSEHSSLYKQLGEPTLVFADYGRDEIVWWKLIRTDLGKYSELRIMKSLLVITGLIVNLVVIWLVFNSLRSLLF